MLNPYRLNALACDELLELQNTDERSFIKILSIEPKNRDDRKTFVRPVRKAIMNLQKLKQETCNFPLAWKGQGKPAMGYVNIAPAWEERGEESGRTGIETPIAIPATYQDTRMIAQRSCFTVHGSRLEPMMDIVTDRLKDNPEYCLKEFLIDANARKALLGELSMLGITYASVFPDLDRLGFDLEAEVDRMGKNGDDNGDT